MSTVALTYRDYAALPDDGRRYELWEGTLHELTSPATRHQHVLGKLHVILCRHVDERALGLVYVAPLDVILSDHTVLQPDIIFVARNHASVVADRGVEGPPTLAIEILSPSTAADDRGRKRDLYARYGVPFYWIVDGEAETVEAYVLEGDSYRLAASAAGMTPVDLPPFEGLGLAPASLFPPR
jgi:Uma2 family endonuclease